VCVAHTVRFPSCLVALLPYSLPALVALSAEAAEGGAPMAGGAGWTGQLLMPFRSGTEEGAGRAEHRSR
jgi:hypothetical protein